MLRKYFFLLIVVFQIQAMDNQSTQVVILHTGEKVSAEAFKFWDTLEKFGNLDNIEKALHHDLYKIAEGGKAQSKSRAQILKKYGLPIKHTEMTENQKKIILATRKLTSEQKPNYGYDFIHPVTKDVIQYYYVFNWLNSPWL